MSDGDSVEDALNLEDLYAWVDEIPLSKPKRNIARDFADAIPLAEILKYYFPRLVELHNYVPANGLAKKVENWNTLNRKVLSKLNVNISTSNIEKLVSAKPGMIERLLSDMKTRIEQIFLHERDTVRLYGGSNVPAAVQEERARISEEEADRVVPYTELEKMEEELREKDDVIASLTAKLAHLDSLVKLKDQRIRDLTQQVDHYQVMSRGCSKEKAKFGNK